MARKADNFIDQLKSLRQPPVFRVKPHFGQTLPAGGAAAKSAPKLRRQRGDRVLRKPHGHPHLTDGAFGAVMDHCGAEPGAVASIAFIDMLNDLFAALMFEINVNVGRLVAGLRDKAFKHHGANFGADRGDPQSIAYHRIGRRAAALT